MNEADKKEVMDLIAGATKPITDQVTTLTKAVEPVGGLKTQLDELGKNVKVVVDTMAQDKQAAADGGKGKKTTDADGKPLSLADVQKLLDDRDAKQANAVGRGQFIAANLGKLPKAYQNQLGSDPAKWADEARAIQGQFEADVKGLGVKPESLGTPSGDGGTTPAQEKVDLTKLPAFERLHLGLAKQYPVPAAVTKSEQPAAK